MRIDVRSEGLELTPQLRQVAVSRLLSALGPFGAHIALVGVRLETSTPRTQPATTICDVAVSLHPSGEIRVRGEEPTMPGAIDRAAEEIRSAVEREVARPQAAPRASYVAEAAPGSLKLVLNDNQISQQQREWLERPKNYMRPICIREYWRPPRVEDDEMPEELQLALPRPR
jgi:ribosome-associated translation inhibitor RaiA